ncbi:class I SAM-dependent methyltransferase [Phenylobacterium sp.]|uniref:class I SAM-dependent methyltransferase n=1 Tax=Phenylobacterium sp. TaxID=1871053 RepID=UPI0027326243|nr:methyltransferase [Phenylobacterium sp.]MDP3658454.1 methyltransferase [Phenylobacterium sp.]
MARDLLLAAVAVLALTAGAANAQNAAAPPAYVAAAVADKSRPATDSARDADRRPMDMLAFAEVAPGQTVGDLLPGGGYFTRIFAKTVGSAGKVYAIITPAQAEAATPPAIRAVAADPAYGNIEVVTTPFETLVLPTKADVIWTSQNYHDLHGTRPGRPPTDVAKVNKAVFDALKPGGLFIVLDHAASPGAPLEVVDTLHRIDPQVVKSEVIAAGFTFDGESPMLRNSADDHTLPVFDPKIRGHTDQFVYRFRKPK